VGLLAEADGPVQGAMVADLLLEEKRTIGFGVLRVSSNITWVNCPVLGELLVGISYLLLFILDALQHNYYRDSAFHFAGNKTRIF